MVGFLAYIGTVLVTIFWGGHVTATLWGWFLVPLGVKAITYWHAVGLGALFGVFMGTRGIEKEEGDITASMLVGLCMSAVVPAMCLLFGWIAKSQM
jgi:hypothetical protein